MRVFNVAATNHVASKFRQGSTWSGSGVEFCQYKGRACPRSVCRRGNDRRIWHLGMVARKLLKRLCVFASARKSGQYSERIILKTMKHMMSNGGYYVVWTGHSIILSIYFGTTSFEFLT